MPTLLIHSKLDLESVKLNTETIIALRCECESQKGLASPYALNQVSRHGTSEQPSIPSRFPNRLFALFVTG